ncbi:MAG TPA: hypothetical protein VF727_03735 [Allosphingosinicella sp.]
MTASAGIPDRLWLLLGAALVSACDAAPSAAPADNATNAGAASVAPAAEPADSGSGNNAAEEVVAPAASAEPAPAPPEAANGPWSKGGYTLSGTEPFWGGTVTPTRIIYMTPEEQKGEKVTVTAAYGDERETYTGTLGGKPFVLTLTKQGPCSNGMSDHQYAYTAELEVRGETRRGCADRR